MTNSSLSFPTAENILSEEFLSKYRGRQPEWGFNGLGYVVYKRTYARLKADGSKEEWNETVERCVRGAQKIGAGYTTEEAERLYDLVFNLKCNFAGRSLWLLGTSTVDRFGANGLINCFFSNVEVPEDFCFIFENLMLGAGVGFSVKRETIYNLPKIKAKIEIQHQASKDADFIVPDSREGWVELLRRVVNAAFITGKSFTYSTILVRGYGEVIKGFGGTASGPQILMDGISKIVEVFNRRVGKKLRSIDVLDVCNIIASIVVAGNVRRSSQIALGDADDLLFLRAKRWDLGNIPNTRAMSNNTIIADDYSYTSNEFWNGYLGKGEPYGIFNMSLSRSHGRLIDPPMKDCELYPQEFDNAHGTNPCSEITLEDGEACNLAELYLNNIESLEEAIECSILLYKTQKAVCALPYLHEKTNKVIHKNMRIGLGITGICESLEKIPWLDTIYHELRKFDNKWSKERGWPRSIKLTTVKPSGSLSLLGGATPGVHPAYAAYYIRRVRMSTHDTLLKQCKDAGYKVEPVINFDGSFDHNTSVVEFVAQSKPGTILAKDMTAIEQLELVKTIQKVWADNAVSVTVYYSKAELPAVQKWLEENYANSLKCVSFLLRSDHGFKQAPYEEIEKSLYDKTLAGLKRLEITGGNEELLESLECANGACPVR